MPIVLDPQEPAINRGIKTVGVGKKGSQDLSPELAQEILNDLKSNKVSPAAKGAFFAGLMAKGIEPQEQIFAEAFTPGVFNDPSKLVNALASDASEFVRWVCVQLLSGHTLDKQTAYDLGRFLFSDEMGDGARGFIASFLRVRYETPDEYEGLLQALHETILPAFTIPVPKGEPVVQIAEPFDGTDHSYMITPLVGRFVQFLGYRAVHMVGKNSGPKLIMNLWDIASALGQQPMTSSTDLSLEKPSFGWFCYENAISPAIDRWNVIRRQTIKRPFMSTIERFINPLKADIVVASAFHPPYGEKMMTIAERAGFKGSVIIRNGIEGSVAFPLLRPVKMLLSAKGMDSQYKRHEIVLDPPTGFDVEQMIEPMVEDNVRLIQEHIKKGFSGDRHFDQRVQSTCKGLEQAIQWLKENVHDLG